MVKKILWVGLIVGSTACSHLPFVHKSPPPDAQGAAKPPVATATANDPAMQASTPASNATTAEATAAANLSDAMIAPPPGYETAQAARRSLEAREDVQTHANAKGWWIVEIPTEHTIWAFTPDDHPAHPAAVAREAVNENGVIRIRMAVLCTASKQACDALIEEFKPLNEEMRKRLQQNLQDG